MSEPRMHLNHNAYESDSKQLFRQNLTQPSCTISLKYMAALVTDVFCYRDRRREVVMHLHLFIGTAI